MVALREALNREHGAARGDPSPSALAIRSIVRAVVDFPQVNARFDDETGVLTLHEAVHLGVATQTDNGLVVPGCAARRRWTCGRARRPSTN